MSIFKRLSKKKPGEKDDLPDELVLDEAVSLIEEDETLPIPRDTEDAVPSLSSLTAEEQQIIQSILSDQTTPRTTPSPAEIDLDLPPITPRSKKSVDDILNDDSYRSALSVLKGEAMDVDFEQATPEDDELFAIKDRAAELDAARTLLNSDIMDADADITEDEIQPTQDNEDDGAIIDSKIELETERDVVMTSVNDIEAMTEAETEAVTEAAEDTTPAEALEIARPGRRRVTLTEMRGDVGQITNDIENGEALYRRAQQRVENLSRFIEKAEVDFSLLDRLEPENKTLKSENLILNSELVKRKDKISQLSASLEDLQRRYGDAQSDLNATQSKLAQTLKNLENTERDVVELNSLNQELRIKMDRTRNDFDVESRENRNLRQKITEVTEQLDRATSDKLNNAKQVETLKIDLNDQTRNREKLRQEVTDLRQALDEAQRQNTTMRGEIGGVHEEIRSFKTQYEFNILKRDERITDLESQIVELNDQVRLKAEIIESTTRDIALLRKERTSQDLERERLEKTVKQQSFQLNSAEEEILKSKKTANELDLKYQDVASALAAASERRDVSAPAARPDIMPHPTTRPSPQLAAPAPEAKSEPAIAAPESADNSSEAPTAERIAPTPHIDDEIEDMLTDYKLGIRSKIG